MKIPRGIRNANPGNLILTNIPWRGKVPNKENTDRKFEQFRDTDGVPGIVWGIRAMMMDVWGDIKKDGKNTLNKLIPEYAPSHENNTKAYIKTLSQNIGIGPDDKLVVSQKTLCALAKWISRVENGGHWLTNQQIEQAWRLL